MNRILNNFDILVGLMSYMDSASCRAFTFACDHPNSDEVYLKYWLECDPLDLAAAESPMGEFLKRHTQHIKRLHLHGSFVKLDVRPLYQLASMTKLMLSDIVLNLNDVCIMCVLMVQLVDLRIAPSCKYVNKMHLYGRTEFTAPPHLKRLDIKFDKNLVGLIVKCVHLDRLAIFSMYYRAFAQAPPPHHMAAAVTPQRMIVEMLWRHHLLSEAQVKAKLEAITAGRNDDLKIDIVSTMVDDNNNTLDICVRQSHMRIYIDDEIFPSGLPYISQRMYCDHAHYIERLIVCNAVYYCLDSDDFVEWYTEEFPRVRHVKLCNLQYTFCKSINLELVPHLESLTLHDCRIEVDDFVSFLQCSSTSLTTINMVATKFGIYDNRCHRRSSEYLAVGRPSLQHVKKLRFSDDCEMLTIHRRYANIFHGVDTIMLKNVRMCRLYDIVVECLPQFRGLKFLKFERCDFNEIDDTAIEIMCALNLDLVCLVDCTNFDIFVPMLRQNVKTLLMQ